MKLPLETLRELLEYHYDRRERLYEFLTAMHPEELTRVLNVGWKSINGILVHCLFAEEFWVQHALQKRPRPGYDPDRYRDVASLRALAGEVRGRTLEYVSGLAGDAMSREESVTFSSGTTVRFSLGKAFLHVITHDTHHRGQVLTVARQLGYEPPELDLM